MKHGKATKRSIACNDYSYMGRYGTSQSYHRRGHSFVETIEPQIQFYKEHIYLNLHGLLQSIRVIRRSSHADCFQVSNLELIAENLSSFVYM